MTLYDEDILDILQQAVDIKEVGFELAKIRSKELKAFPNSNAYNVHCGHLAEKIRFNLWLLSQF